MDAAFGELRSLIQGPVSPEDWWALVALLDRVRSNARFEEAFVSYARAALAEQPWTQRQLPPRWMNRLMYPEDEDLWEYPEAPWRVPEVGLCTALELSELLGRLDHNKDSGLWWEMWGEGSELWDALLTSEDLRSIECLKFTCRNDDYATTLCDPEQFASVLRRWPVAVTCLSVPGLLVEEFAGLVRDVTSLELMGFHGDFGEPWGLERLEVYLGQAKRLERLHVQGFMPQALPGIVEAACEAGVEELFVDAARAGYWEEVGGETEAAILACLRGAELGELSLLCVPEGVAAALGERVRGVRVVSAEEAWRHGWDTWSYA